VCSPISISSAKKAALVARSDLKILFILVIPEDLALAVISFFFSLVIAYFCFA
jgi:hypothetical protein